MDFLIVVFVVLFNSDIIYISEWEKKMLVGMLVSLVLVDCFHIMHSIDTLYGRTTFSSNFKYKKTVNQTNFRFLCDPGNLQTTFNFNGI